ncbi:hypothetical protein WJX75_003420 [Coccomyxa subellipsoidea]|uniref:Nucleotide-diphospho-sugar transferase domain-containing protein n=1 Tax=Coccomyxa subellipsoidea TaxID=248742 RepID=A0ABR2YR76_9CHLO
MKSDRAPVVQLTAALANSRSRDGIVIVTWASAAYLDFLRNWVHQITLLEVENFLIGAMDSEVAQYLRQQNIPYFDMQAGMYSDMQGHLMKGTKAARMLAFNKIGVAQTLNTFGLDALLCDADVVWLRDPSDYFSGLEEADILVATDGLGVSNAKDDDGLESPEAALRHQMSTGIVFLRHGRGARSFLDAWDSALRRNASRTEQQAFNAVARVGVKPLKTHPDNWRVFYGMGRTVTFGILPASGFANGHSYFVQRLYDVMRVSPYAVHMSYVFGGVAAKRNRLREEQIWLDDPGYYDQKRLLTLDIHVPAIPDNFERLKNDYMVELHLKLMQHQLDQLVVGFAMAMTLKRTLVMPRLVCFCDRFWSPLERCRAPGAGRMQLPFVCPLDQILRPSHFGDAPELYGPPIAFREHSFWDNPDTPAELKDNQVEVVPVAKKEGSAAKRIGNQLVIPANLSDGELWKTMQPHDDIEVLSVRNVTGIFSGFSDRNAAEGFWRRMAHITGIWCCTYDGGVPYRMIPRLTIANASL